MRHHLLLLAGAVGGVLAFGALRLVLLPPHAATHYHANFAVVVGGERVDLSASRYMQDVARCTADPSHVEPEDRVHLHSNNADVVHVHAAGVTWGHFLANLGFGVGDDYLVTDQARHVTTADSSLTFILNGDPVRTIRNLAIRSGDRLLVSYGAEPVAELMRSQFANVASNAETFNTQPDPGSCAGPVEHEFADRLRRAFWF